MIFRLHALYEAMKGCFSMRFFVQDFLNFSGITRKTISGCREEGGNYTAGDKSSEIEVVWFELEYNEQMYL